MITLNNKTYEFKFTFSQVKELMSKTGVNLKDFAKFAENFDHTALIGSIGTGLSEEEVTQWLDEKGFHDGVKVVMDAFNEEVLKFFADPNQTGQAQ